MFVLNLLHKKFRHITGLAISEQPVGVIKAQRLFEYDWILISEPSSLLIKRRMASQYKEYSEPQHVASSFTEHWKHSADIPLSRIVFLDCSIEAFSSFNCSLRKESLWSI